MRRADENVKWSKTPMKMGYAHRADKTVEKMRTASEKISYGGGCAGSVLRCTGVGCGRLTTDIEATSRRHFRGRCGFCGSRLSSEKILMGTAAA